MLFRLKNFCSATVGMGYCLWPLRVLYICWGYLEYCWLKSLVLWLCFVFFFFLYSFVDVVFSSFYLHYLLPETFILSEKLNTYINNKNSRGRGRGFDSERNDSDVNGPMLIINFFSFLFLFRSQFTVSQKDEHMMTWFWLFFLSVDRPFT